MFLGAGLRVDLYQSLHSIVCRVSTSIVVFRSLKLFFCVVAIFVLFLSYQRKPIVDGVYGAACGYTSFHSLSAHTNTVPFPPYPSPREWRSGWSGAFVCRWSPLLLMRWTNGNTSEILRPNSIVFDIAFLRRVSRLNRPNLWSILLPISNQSSLYLPVSLSPSVSLCMSLSIFAYVCLSVVGLD